MFSYFEKGINQTEISKSIDILTLHQLIIDNPLKYKINRLREIYSKDRDLYKIEKRKLPNITPNCILNKRSLKGDEFNLNFRESSGYIYFDIDNLEDVDSFKSEFIVKYRDKVSLVCKSISNKGISIFFKLSKTIKTKEDHSLIWNHIKSNIFGDEKIDSNCSDIGRSMFISYDPEAYFNTKNVLVIDDLFEEDELQKGVNQPILVRGDNNTLNEPYLEIVDFNEFMSILKFETQVNNISSIVDFIPIKFSDVKFSKNIKDGQKHKIFTYMIHTLVHLNPTVDKKYIFSYLLFINNNFCNPKMDFKKLTTLFNFVYSSIKENNNYEYKGFKIKNIHFNKKSNISGDDKRIIASKLNGTIRSNSSIQKIKDAKEKLREEGLKITKLKIQKLTGLSKSTVSRHFDNNEIDLDQLLTKFNCQNYQQILNNLPLTNSFVKIEKEYIHPTCPVWVTNYYNSIS